MLAISEDFTAAGLAKQDWQPWVQPRKGSLLETLWKLVSNISEMRTGIWLTDRDI